MRRDDRVYTVPADHGKGWWNVVEEKVLSRHRVKDAAVAAGREIATRLGVEHVVEEATREGDVVRPASQDTAVVV